MKEIIDEDEWTLMVMRVVFEGIKHKIDNDIPLTEMQQRVMDEFGPDNTLLT